MHVTNTIATPNGRQVAVVACEWSITPITMWGFKTLIHAVMNNVSKSNQEGLFHRLLFVREICANERVLNAIDRQLFEYDFFQYPCRSTFRKSIFKQQFGCRFDIMDSISSFYVFWHMQLYMSWYIIQFFGFIFTSGIFFIFSSTHELTSSIDVVLVLSIGIEYIY